MESSIPQYILIQDKYIYNPENKIKSVCIEGSMIVIHYTYDSLSTDYIKFNDEEKNKNTMQLFMRELCEKLNDVKPKNVY